MRLSLLKAAHANFFGASCRKSGPAPLRFFPTGIGKRQTPEVPPLHPAVTHGCGERKPSWPATTVKPESRNFVANRCRSRINTGHSALRKNTSGDAFGVPRLCCLLRCLLTSSLLFSWLPSSLASLLLLSWLPFFYSPFVESTSNTARDTLQLTNV